MLMRPTSTPSVDGPVVLWRGWLRKLGRFSKRWQRRYFVFVKGTDAKELRYYGHSSTATHPEGVMSLADATGVCYLDAVQARSSSPGEASSSDHKFAILTAENVWLLGFNDHDVESAQEDGLALLGALSAFYPLVDVLHAGYLSKRRERTVQSPKSIIAYWKRHFFVYLASGDLLYFNDDSLSALQGRVDVKHAPTVRVTGEQQSLLRAKKEAGFFKLTKARALEHGSCLIWIATPPSKMFVLQVYDEKDRVAGVSASAKKWLSLLLQGHAETKYVQLEQCFTSNNYDQTTEVVSALRVGIPDELRGALWKGFSGAYDAHASATARSPINAYTNRATNAVIEAMVLDRLQALSVHGAKHPTRRGSDTDDDVPTSDRGGKKPSAYPSDAVVPEWELASRRRLLVALARYKPYCHPCPWRVTCLLLAYLDEESAFWVVNSVIDHILPGYFHGYRPALLVDGAVFRALLHDQAPSLCYHLETLCFPLDALVQRWFVSVFTATQLPLSTVLRIWDLVFAQGLRILFGIGVALLLKTEHHLFGAANVSEVWAALHASERSTVDADGLFAHVFKDDLHMPWLTDELLARLRQHERSTLLASIASRIASCHAKLSVLNRAQETYQSLLQAVDIYDELGNQEVMGTLRRQLGDADASAMELAVEFKEYQARWVALSSQVAACPLGLHGHASDVQSWLAQVKEGKISGAGTDAAANQAFACLFPSAAPLPDPFELSIDTMAERFLLGLVMVAKSACAARLHFLAARQVAWWHRGQWLATVCVEKKAFVSDASGGLEPKDYGVAEGQFLERAERLQMCLQHFATADGGPLQATAEVMAGDLKESFLRVECAIRGPAWLP